MFMTDWEIEVENMQRKALSNLRERYDTEVAYLGKLKNTYDKLLAAKANAEKLISEYETLIAETKQNVQKLETELQKW